MLLYLLFFPSIKTTLPFLVYRYYINNGYVSYIVIKLINNEIFHKQSHKTKHFQNRIYSTSIYFVILCNHLNNVFQTISADSVLDAIKNFKDRGNSDDTNTNGKQSSDNSDDTQNTISAAISKFTNRGNNFEQFSNIF